MSKSKILSFDEFKELISEEFYNPFDELEDISKNKVEKIIDKGGLLQLRKESYNPARIEWSKRPGGEYTVRSKTQFARGEIVEICPVIMLGEIAKTVDGLKDIIFEINKENNEWALVLGYGSLYKHSDKPNCEYAYNKTTKQMYILTKTIIKVSDELSINYGQDYWAERTNFNMMANVERSDQNQGMPVIGKQSNESEVQPNSADNMQSSNMKQLSSPKNPNNPVYTGQSMLGGQS